MWKSLVTVVLLLVSISLSSCSVGVGGLKQYVDSLDGYKFLYPNGWAAVEVQDASEGVDIVFRDIIERSENLSVIISDVPKGKTLESLGTPSEVGYRFLKRTNARGGSEREVEFIKAGSYETEGQKYYILEYAVAPSDREKQHNIATVAVSRGKLFTFSISTSEQRWQNVRDLFEVAAKSFTVY
ncbi:photosystem II reaction center PsbP family protein [Lusitaniella coriacea LEGE 07157]|uniref:Photosystem II reaction center PsbP family protein n=1 Tax=Lusitaniella coriacea LEGE 07157 TaxID=945747 RepID=A0A8J7B8S2_9CYAN|nr:photosystem II reaction center PsbP [Lusitaniella coriacea]MBE9115063.1 photosystem II reaction center PsbP family protein [Lusitaniella coriacea LEGE 07157]